VLDNPSAGVDEGDRGKAIRYAPEFNPIEMLWSVFFFDCLTFLVIDKSFFINWFTKCCCPLITEYAVKV